MSKYAKAITAALVAGYAMYQSLSPPITSAQWIGIAVTTVVAGLAVWAVPNTSSDAVGKHSEE